MNAQQARWLPTLNEFDFKIMYIKGKENQVTNALSIRVHAYHIVAMSSYGTYLQERILQAGQHDDRYQ